MSGKGIPMRPLAFIFAVLLFLPLSAGAQAPLGDDVYVMKDASVPVTAMAAWRDGGAVETATGMSAATAPYGAVRYSAKQVHWPTARVSVLSFDRETGGVLHPITDETLLYVLSGSAEVGVGDDVVSVTAGDVVSFPSGVLLNAGRATDAKIVTWTAPSLTGEETPTLVKGADVAEGGGGAIKLKRYEFPGNSVRAVKLAGGNSTNPNSAKTDSLIYVTGGPMTFHQNGQSFVVNEGDFIREIAGLMHNWTITSDSGFVTTSGKPLDMDQINPDEATDRPPER